MAYVSGSSSSTASTDFFIQDLGTAAFYGLEFIDSRDDLVVKNQNMSSKPSVLIEGTTILLDYSDIQSTKDKEFLDILFGSMNSVGGTFSTGFTLTSAFYKDSFNNYEADLSASVTLNNYSNYKVLGTISAIGSTIETNLYHPDFFETVPQISSAVGLTGATFNIRKLLNYYTSDSTSFVGNDFQIGDYLDFSTSENVGRYTINGISLDGFSREQIAFRASPPAVIENLKGTEVVVGHSRRVYPTTSPTSLQQTNAIVHKVSSSLVDGKSNLTVDGVIDKPLILSRGVMYIFIVDNDTDLKFNLTGQAVQNGSPYTDDGLYTVSDGILLKKTVFFIPNNNTPDQLYYTSSNINVGGLGALKVTGGFDYIYSALFNSGTGTGSNEQNSASSGYFY
tara:strand:- start:889 stop:2070 length:1182 start_codon:yes stop_codon:yes gene_type:complete